MISRLKYRMLFNYEKGSSLKTYLLCLFVLSILVLPQTLSSQVINNSGAAISITSDAAITSKDFENNDGSFANNGNIELSGSFLNDVPAVTNGNGLYMLKGNWTDYGIFTHGLSKVTFNGSSRQIITHGSTGETFYKLSIENIGDTISQIANAGNTFRVRDSLSIISGVLDLDNSTDKFIVNGNALINGGLSYDEGNKQITTIDGNLSGTGDINMSGGGIPHLLNLFGTNNDIGTLTTHPLSYSTVDYLGANQGVFNSPNYRNLNISNTGIKTLENNSIIGNNLVIAAGTSFDLGTTAISVDILDSAVITGNLDFNEVSTKNVNVEGDLTGAGSIDMTGAGMSHILFLGGSENNIGSYLSAGSESTVDYKRDDNQSVFISQNYRNLKVSGDSAKILSGTITASGILTMLAGNINSNGHLLKVTNSSLDAIQRENGTIIGKLQREIGVLEGDYLYPIGSDLSYNPMHIKFRDLDSGPLTAQYIPDSIGNDGLPIEDVHDGDELWRSLPEGYWNLIADASMNSENFDVRLNYNGFSGIDPSCRILRRNGIDPLTLDGRDGSIDGALIDRDTLINPISNISTDFAIGKGRPHIKDHPSDSAVCEFLNSLFDVYSNRLGPLTYQWQVDTAGTFFDIPLSDPVYSNSTTAALKINAAPYSMNGNKYRVIVGDQWGNLNYSTDALFPVYTNPVVSMTGIDSVKCLGATNGAIRVDILQGTPGFTYRWNYTKPTGSIESTSEDLLNARYGKHYLSVFDANGCLTLNNLFIVPIADPMQVNEDITHYGINDDYNISCNGKNDGQIIVYADGNGDPATFNYQWMLLNTGEILSADTPILSGIGANIYQVTVTDEQGCEGIKDITLVEPPPINVSRLNTKYPGNFDISCFGLSDGIINLNIEGGHRADAALPADLYSWSMTNNPLFNQTTQDINTLLAGEYKLAIQDSFNCFADTLFTFVLESPEKYKLDTTFIASYNGYEVSCKSSNNSELDLNVSGSYPGNGTYTYFWTSPDGEVINPDVLDQTGFPEGNYNLHVTDSINCFVDWAFVINAPDSISVAPVISDYNGYEISCFGFDNGSINLNTSGGISAFPYSYEWSSPDGSGFVSNIEDQNNLTSGNYTVKITDANLCEVVWNYVFDEPNKLISNIDSFSIACFNINNGAADLTVMEGVPPYTYIWNNGDVTEDIDSLFTGIYYVDIRDLNNCLLSDTTEVTEPPDIIVNLDAPLQFNGRMISCFGESDAVLNASVVGGVGEYTYNWKRGIDWSQSGLNLPSVSDLPAGLYTLEIVDENLCSDSASFLVEQPLKMKTEVFATDPSCFGKTDGQITLIVQGGTPAFTFNWMPNGQTTQTAVNLGIGEYDVIITDLNACKDSAYGILDQPQLITINKPEDDFINPYCPDVFDGSIRYEINGGTQPYEMVLYNLTNHRDSLVLDDGNDIVVSDLQQGKYRLKIIDNKLCVLSDTSILKAEKNLCINVPNAFTPNGDGVNDTWEIELIDIYPEAQIEIYNRWGDMVYFASKGYSKPWDGTFKGRELPIDSYFYVIDLKNGRHPVSGDITIIK